MSSTTGARRTPSLAARLALLSATLALLGGALAWRPAHFRRDLAGYDAAQKPSFARRKFPLLSSDQVVQLGLAHHPNRAPTSSYLSHRQPKVPGVERIGVFGCSFTFGEEVAPGSDFPSLLQELLDREHPGRTEVINFGVGGYGLHQSALLWRMIGRAFDLDTVVLNLFPFHRERDRSFVHPWFGYAPVHARFVIEEDRLRLIEVVGRDRLEAARRYHRLFPPWRYWHYDAKAPAALACLVPRSAGPARNPFYHSGDVEAEVVRTYELLIREVADATARVLVLCNGDDACPFTEESIGRANVSLRPMAGTQLSWQLAELYRAPQDHLSPWGNALIAAELRGHLAGADSPPTVYQAVPPAPPWRDLTTPVPAAALWTAELEWRGAAVARLVQPDVAGNRFEPVAPDPAVRAMLVLGSASPWGVVPLGRALDPGEALTLHCSVAGRPREQTLGRVEVLGPALGRVTLPDDEVRAVAERCGLPLPSAGLLGRARRGRLEGSAPSLLRLGPDRLASGRQTAGGLEWTFEPPGLLRFRGAADQAVEWPQPGDEGELDLCFRSTAGGPLLTRVPFARLRAFHAPPRLPDQPAEAVAEPAASDPGRHERH